MIYLKQLIKKLVNNKYYIKIKNNAFWSNLFKNSFWAFSGDAIASILGLIITILLIRCIGSEKYGILVLAQTYMTMLDTILNIQSWKSVIQYGQKSLINRDINSLNGYIKLGSILDISTAILGGIVSIFIAPYIGKMLNWSSELIICSQIFSITIFSHFSGTPTAILRILNKFNLVALQKFITAIFKLIMIVLTFIIKNDTVGIIDVVIAYCFADIIGNFLLVFLAFYEYSKLNNHKCKIYKSKLPNDTKEFTKFTIWGTLGDIVDVPVNYFDVFIISFLGNELVSVFKVFKQCIAIIQKVTSPIQQSILPQFSELSAKGDVKRGFEVVMKIRNAIIKIIGPVILIIGITSPIWLNMIYGKIYSENWYILCIYLLVQVVALSYTTVHPYFLSLDKAKHSTLYVLLSNVIYIFLALILVHYIGMLGIVLAYAIQCFIVIYLKVRNIKKNSI